MKLQGIFVPVAIPFDHNGDLYAVKVQHNIEKWNRTGITGFVVSGCESAYLSSAEKIRMWEWVAQYAAPEKMLIAWTGRPSVHETLELTNRAAELGYKAAMVAGSDGVYACAVADRSPIPVILEGGEFAHPNIAPQRVATCAVNLADSFAAGATAAIIEFANAAPYAAISIWEAHRTREHEAALDWQTRIARAVELVTNKYGVAGLKHAMDLNGYYGGPPRLPLVGLTPDAKKEIERAFDGLKG
jgi:4-hydroxy-2-oxoglutarate aldolase